MKWVQFAKPISSCLSLFTVLLLSSLDFFWIDFSLLLITDVNVEEYGCSLFFVIHHQNPSLSHIDKCLHDCHHFVSHGQLIFWDASTLYLLIHFTCTLLTLCNANSIVASSGSKSNTTEEINYSTSAFLNQTCNPIKKWTSFVVDNCPI